MYQKQFADYFSEHRQALVADICRLVQIESVRGTAKPGMPYGEGPAMALDAAADMARRMGFTVTHYDNRVIAIDMNDKPAQLDILAHLDVVPGGDCWTVTSPFQPVEKDGILYGRGVSDDKGPAVAALYAMKAVKDLGIPLSKNVRLLLGSDEECGSSDVAYYYQQMPEAPMTFSPDADFPLINTEKGRVHGRFSAQWESHDLLPRIVALHCGQRANVVPRTAEADIVGLGAVEVASLVTQISDSTGVQFRISGENDVVHILAEGTAAHASTPQLGNNALTGLLTLLCALPLPCDEVIRRLRILRDLFPHGEFFGQSAHMACCDDLSGDTTVALTVLHIDNGHLQGEFDCRTAVSARRENTAEVLAQRLSDGGITPDFVYTDPHHVPADSPLVQELLGCYETYTGQKGTALAIGGFTYVHDLKNGVAFGCAMPGFDTRMHGADEQADINTLLLSGQMFAQAIVDLCQ